MPPEVKTNEPRKTKLTPRLGFEVYRARFTFTIPVVGGEGEGEVKFFLIGPRELRLPASFRLFSPLSLNRRWKFNYRGEPDLRATPPIKQSIPPDFPPSLSLLLSLFLSRDPSFFSYLTVRVN